MWDEVAAKIIICILHQVFGTLAATASEEYIALANWSSLAELLIEKAIEVCMLLIHRSVSPHSQKHYFSRVDCIRTSSVWDEQKKIAALLANDVSVLYF